MKISTKDMCLIAVFAAVIAILAQITVPIGIVPFSMQTFGVALTGVILGARRGVLAVIVYLLLGAFGAPVFVGFGGGFHRITGPWGGYLLSYPLVVFIIGWGADRLGKPDNKNPLINAVLLALCLVAGAALNLTMGSLQLSIINKLSLRAAFSVGFKPFIIPEILKMTMVFAAGLSTRRVLIKSGVLR